MRYKENHPLNMRCCNGRLIPIWGNGVVNIIALAWPLTRSSYYRSVKDSNRKRVHCSQLRHDMHVDQPCTILFRVRSGTEDKIRVVKMSAPSGTNLLFPITTLHRDSEQSAGQKLLYVIQ